MIALADATALISCSPGNPTWKILAMRGKDWDLKVRIPKVSYEEALGHARRAADKNARTLKGIADKIGDSVAFRQALAEALAQPVKLTERLNAALEAADAVLVDPVEIPLMEIVRRQVDRRKPCDDKGNGNRDTINWLTLLDVAANHPDEKVVWISDDTDFVDRGTGTFHAELIAEAEERGVGDRITVLPSFAKLLVPLLRQDGVADKLPAARLQLCERAICDYVITFLLPGMADSELLGQMTLPAEDSDDFEIVVDVQQQGPIDSGTVWTFTTKVLLEMEIADLRIFPLATVTGMVTTDEYDQITGGEVTEIILPGRRNRAAGLESILRGTEAVRALAESMNARPNALAALAARPDYIKSMSAFHQVTAGYSNPAGKLLGERVKDGLAAQFGQAGKGLALPLTVMPTLPGPALSVLPALAVNPMVGVISQLDQFRQQQRQRLRNISHMATGFDVHTGERRDEPERPDGPETPPNQDDKA